MNDFNNARGRRPARRRANTQPTPAAPANSLPVQPVQPSNKVGMKYITELLNAKLPAIAKVIPPGLGITAEGLVQNALQQIVTAADRRKLMMSSPHTVLYSILCAARLGLDFVADQAYLVAMTKWEKDPESGQKVAAGTYTVLWPGYKGLISIAARAGFALTTQEVRENDVCNIVAGTENKIDHKVGFGPRGNTVGVYCVIRNKATNEVVGIEVMGNEDLEKVDTNTAIWRAFPGEMGRKSVIKRAVKWLPKDHADLRLVSTVEQRIDNEEPLDGLLPEVDPEPAASDGPLNSLDDDKDFPV